MERLAAGAGGTGVSLDVTSAAARPDGTADEELLAEGPPRAALRHGLRRWELVGLALPVLVLAWAAWERRWMSDDGFINLRIVDQVLAGHGPVFNAGERVEAATSPLWVAVLAFGDVVTPIRLEWIAVSFGIASSLVGLVAAMVGSLRLWRRSGDGVVVPVGAVCLVAISPVWDFSSSGLEGGLAFCWLGVALLLLQRWAVAEHHPAAAAAVVAGVGPLVRPDFAVVSLVLLGALLLGERGRSVRRLLKLVGQLAVVPVAYEAFRIAYYGALVPNTYFAKEGGESNWGAGWTYLGNFVGPYRLWVPLVVLGGAAIVPLVVGLRDRHETRAALVAAAFPVAGVLSALAIVRLGADFMHGRMLLPSLFAILAPVATMQVRRSTAAALLVVPWAGLCLVALRPPSFTPDEIGRPADHRAVIQQLLGEDHPITLEDFHFAPGDLYYVDLDEPGLYAGSEPLKVDGRRVVPVAQGSPDRVLLTYAIGAVGYHAGPDVYVADLLGLGDTLTARLELHRRGPLPGHEKALPPAWAWARYVDPSVEPDADLFVPPDIAIEVAPTLRDYDEGDFAAQVDAARQVLRCPEVEELLATPRRSLSPSTVADNVRRSFTDFRLRIPPRPTDARRALC